MHRSRRLKRGCGVRVLNGRSFQPGMAEGTITVAVQGQNVTCMPVTFTSFTGAHKRGIYESDDLRDIALSVIPASDLNRIEHILFVLVDDLGRVVMIANGSSGSEHVCAFRFQDVAPFIEAGMERLEKARRKPGALYMVHNHPSGSAMFSAEDVSMTAQVAKLHETMPFGLADSMVVARGGSYVSMATLQEELPSIVAVKGIGFRRPNRA